MPRIFKILPYIMTIEHGPTYRLHSLESLVLRNSLNRSTRLITLTLHQSPARDPAAFGNRTMSSFWSRFATPVYKNTGSVARDHLASERTFLAWIRTGLGFVALGIAIERFSQLDLTELLPSHQRAPETEEDRQIKAQDKKHSQFLVGTLMAMGSGSILYGTGRYFSNLKALERGQFRPAWHGTAVLGASVAALAGGVFGSAFARRRPDRNEMKS